jgi:hypothetical protein
MSDPIKGADAPKGLTPQALEQAQEAQGVQGGFDAAMVEQAQAAGLQGAQALDASQVLIQQVAQQLHSGALAGPDQALERVIDGIVQARFSALPPQQRLAMARDLKATLQEDPFFTLEVEEALALAMEQL